MNKNIFLAVLPFQILSDDPKIEMICQGLVMDLIHDLSRFRSFRIIAYDTAKGFQPNEQSDSPKLAELQLDYLVKGMARKQGDSLVFNLQLINMTQNRVVWAEKFNSSYEDIFHVQESIVERIVVSLQNFVDHDLLTEIHHKPLTALNVYECWIRGYRELKKGTIEADEQARVYFRQAMEMDSHYARAYTGMSLSYFNEWSCQLWTRWEVSKNGAFEWAQKALELDEWDHVSNAILGRIYVFNGEYDKGEHYLRKSLRINPNDAETLVLIAYGFVYAGNLKEAAELYERVKRLNPLNSFSTNACGVFVQFELGAVDEAISLAEQHETGKSFVDLSAFQAAAYFLKGDYEKMKNSWNVFLDEFSQKINGGKKADNRTALQWMINVNPYKHETRLKPFWEYISQTNPDELIIHKSEISTSFTNCFKYENGLWNISFKGETAQLPDLKGYRDIVLLLAQPGQSIHCTVLMGAGTLEKGQEVFDEKAKAEYQKRILELQQEIQEAEVLTDNERIEVLHEEYDNLLSHLSRAIGKGGKIRKKSGTVEKCRTAVTWRIHSAIKKISESHASLGKHLEVSIKTGVFCEYHPENPVDWELS